MLASRRRRDWNPPAIFEECPKRELTKPTEPLSSQFCHFCQSLLRPFQKKAPSACIPCTTWKRFRPGKADSDARRNDRESHLRSALLWECGRWDLHPQTPTKSSSFRDCRVCVSPRPQEAGASQNAPVAIYGDGEWWTPDSALHNHS